MRHILRHSLGRSLEQLPELDRLEAAWPVACGKALAARGRITAFTAGVVHIRVEDPQWLDQMRSMTPMLTAELAKIAAVRVTAIHFGGAVPSTATQRVFSAQTSTKPAQNKLPANKPREKQAR